MATNETVSVMTEVQANKLDNLDGKRCAVTDRLQKRDDDRMAVLQKRKEEKESVSAKNESAGFFLSNFTTSKNEIESLLKINDSLDKSDMSNHFDAIFTAIQKLQKFVSDSTMFLSPYEVHKAQAAVTQLQTNCSEKKEELMPKKKFSFQSKKKSGKNVSKSIPQEKERKKEIHIDITECSFTDIIGQTLTKESLELNSKDVALARLENCTVYLAGSPGTLHINNALNCRVFCGPVSGSIFIDGCKDCTFVVGCQQLRVHNTTDSKFYLHVTSRAIIEDSNCVEFAQYNWNYEDLDAHYKLSGLDRNINNWDDVDDFNWLASDKHSPNWGIIPEEKRIEKWQ